MLYKYLYFTFQCPFWKKFNLSGFPQSFEELNLQSDYLFCSQCSRIGAMWRSFFCSILMDFFLSPVFWMGRLGTILIFPVKKALLIYPDGHLNYFICEWNNFHHLKLTEGYLFGIKAIPSRYCKPWRFPFLCYVATFYLLPIIPTGESFSVSLC